MKNKKALFIFRRDLRLEDNVGLVQALDESDLVVPCFIFDPRQVGSSNEYKSSNALQFMIESLESLKKQCKSHGGKLYLFYGQPQKVVKDLIRKNSIDAVYANRDYTPFALDRDEDIKHVCMAEEVPFYVTNDLLLHEPEEIKTRNGDPYSVFTPFYKNASGYHQVRKVKKTVRKNFFKGAIAGTMDAAIYKKITPKTNKLIHVHGDRAQALTIVRGLKKYKNYQKTRDIPAIETTNLSAYLKFGVVSVAHVYHAIKKTLGQRHPLVRQLFWRDFFTHVAYYSPFVFGQPFKDKYKNIAWSRSKKNFKLWCDGKTGFPIVDAGMRQLNQTGFMHNRVRMLTASFLVKDLHIDWRWGEKYFAQKLVDYDPCVNNGNWQWVASTGCDAQPYFRIFNPWTQQKKFDSDCIYIKKWIPELQDVEPKTIHTWFKDSHDSIKGYPRPCVDHDVERKVALARYKRVG